jgi:hypothetical protein
LAKWAPQSNLWAEIPEQRAVDLWSQAADTAGNRPADVLLAARPHRVHSQGDDGEFDVEKERFGETEPRSGSSGKPALLALFTRNNGPTDSSEEAVIPRPIIAPCPSLFPRPSLFPKAGLLV